LEHFAVRPGGLAKIGDGGIRKKPWIKRGDLDWGCFACSTRKSTNFPKGSMTNRWFTTRKTRTRQHRRTVGSEKMSESQKKGVSGGAGNKASVTIAHHLKGRTKKTSRENFVILKGSAYYIGRAGKGARQRQRGKDLVIHTIGTVYRRTNRTKIDRR